MNFKSIRFKLILWYVVVISLGHIFFSGIIYTFISYRLLKDIDHELKEEFQEIANSITFEGGKIDLSHIRILDEHKCSHKFQIVDSKGAELFRSHDLKTDIFSSAYLLQDAKWKGHGLKNISLSEGISTRCAIFPIEKGQKQMFILVGLPLTGYYQQMRGLLTIILITIPLGLVIASGAGWFLSSLVLNPVDKLTTAANRISAERLNERLSVGNPDDEIGRLTITFNNMITRLDKAFKQNKQFTADASHELRTPLTAMKSEGEVALRAERSPEEYRAGIASMLEEVEALSRMIEDLLILSRMDFDSSRLKTGDIRLDELLKEIVDQIKVIADEKDISLKIKDLTAVTLQGDKLRFRQLFMNLLDNAIKYTPCEGKIEIIMRNNRSMVEIEISDTGQGIPPEHIPRIFDRFYRVDKARSREMGGTGLGLSIAKMIVDSYRGEIKVTSQPGKGSRFVVVLPIEKRAGGETLG